MSLPCANDTAFDQAVREADARTSAIARTSAMVDSGEQAHRQNEEIGMSSNDLAPCFTLCAWWMIAQVIRRR